MWLYLFDIDGTIMHSGGAGFRSIRAAFRRLFDHDVTLETLRTIPFHGRTDPLILRDVFTLTGVVPPDGWSSAEATERLIAAYLELLPGEMERSEKRLVYPGVPELLAALHAEPSVHMGLLTGNVEGGARAKLAAFDLNRYFPAGGFGSDSADRREVARIAHARCAQHYGEAYPPDRVIVVGDTAADIDCARAAGFHVVAVATGNVTVEGLRELKPDLIFPDFGDVDTVMEALRRRFPTR